jgi:hypothetical protein
VQAHLDHDEVHAPGENDNQRGQQILGRHRRLREFISKLPSESDRSPEAPNSDRKQFDTVADDFANALHKLTP